MIDLFDNELHGLFKAIGLDGDEVNATAEFIGVDADGVGAIEVGVLFSNFLTHDVVHIDGHDAAL